MSQKILCLGTTKPVLRDLVKKSWQDDADLYKVNPLTGLDATPVCQLSYPFSSPLAAMSSGWRLMAPPTKDGFFISESGPDYGTNTSLWSWWFEWDDASTHTKMVETR